MTAAPDADACAVACLPHPATSLRVDVRRPLHFRQAAHRRASAMLQRRLGLLQAVSLNMSMMVGIGPFITIPALLATMGGGPQAMLGWILGGLVALCDGMVWSELAAAFPGSGGTYHFYDALYGESRPGRLLKFLFVWQFLFSGPLEIATGAIGVAQYVGHFVPSLDETAWRWGILLPGMAGKVTRAQVAAIAVLALVTFLAYRRIATAGRLMVVLWAGMLVTVAWVIATGLIHFDAARAFDFPKRAWLVDGHWLFGLGMALSIAMYDYLGYYQICYLGDEVADPPRTLPRAILISTVAISLVYLVMNLGIVGVLPWREVVESKRVASDLMLRTQGQRAAGVVTALIIWTAVASTFAALLGYSRIPYASARAGHFFRLFAATHPRGEFPHRSLLLVAGMAMLACLADLQTVVTALLTARIPIQFVGQIATLVYWRTGSGGRGGPFRMPLYPLPATIALLGWLYVFGTSEPLVLAYGIGSVVVGMAAFLAWDRLSPPRTVEGHPEPGGSLASPPPGE
jgi:amino acid transporter